MKPWIIGYSFAMMALAACQGQEQPAEKSDAHAAAGRSDNGGDAPTPSAAGTPAPGDAKSRDGFSSHYTSLDLAKCEVTNSQREESHWVERNCPGYRGMPLIVDEGDGRFDVDAGSRNERFQSLLAFNDAPDTIEWRLKDGQPFAIIYRLADATIGASDRSVLMVEHIGTAQRPGCSVAQVAGDTPRANARARELADQLATGFDCANAEPRAIGDAR